MTTSAEVHLSGAASPGEPARRRGHGRLNIGTKTYLAFILVGLICLGALLTLPMGPALAGGLAITLVMVMLLCGIHVAVAMALGAAVGLWKLSGTGAVEVAMSTLPFSSVASWSLTVIPMYVLMGCVLARMGVTGQIFVAARHWLGWVPGGLAVATNFAGAGLSAASGTSVGISHALGRVAIPEMLRARYAPSLATAVVAMCGVLGQMIPPSVILVIYAGVVQTPVGPQLLASMVPGILLAVAFAVLIVVRAKLNPSLAPPIRGDDITWRNRFVSLRGVWPLPVLIVLVLGGLFFGITTATESGALGALGAILIGAWSERRRGLRHILSTLGRSAADTVAAVAGIMLVIISVHMLNLLVTLSGLARDLSRFVVDLGLSKTALLLVLIVVLYLIGTVLDSLAMILLTVPILLPVLEAQQVDLIWFGVFVVLMAEIGLVSPPVGMLAFVVHALSQKKEVNLGQRITLGDVFKGVTWFTIVSLLVAVAMIFLPEIVMWLPNASAVK